MIRPLTDADRAETEAFLSTAPEYNLYLLGNIASLGFNAGFSQFWGDFRADTSTGADAAQLRGVLNRYMTGWVVFGAADADWVGLAQILDTHREGASRLQDNPGGITSFLPYLTRYTAEQVSEEDLMSLTQENFVPQAAPIGVTVRRATLDDLAALCAFYGDAGHMKRTPAAVEQPLRRTRVWIAEERGHIISAALTNAEISDRAMIGGVYTPPSARGRGLSQAVCSALCADLFGDHKRPVLYWETPAAGTVYRKIGFHHVGIWRAVRLRRAG